MKKYISVLFILMTVAASAQQRYVTHTGHVSFYSHAPIEDIEADNHAVSSIISNGQLVFDVPMKSFEFKKSLMQEHFNENYLESDKYPKATFKGMILAFDKIDLKKDGTYPVDVEGDMTIHGVTNKIKTKGSIAVKGNTLHAEAAFPIALKDYKIKIPSLVITNIAEVVQVKADLNYEPYTK